MGYLELGEMCIKDAALPEGSSEVELSLKKE